MAYWLGHQWGFGMTPHPYIKRELDWNRILKAALDSGYKEGRWLLKSLNLIKEICQAQIWGTDLSYK